MIHGYDELFACIKWGHAFLCFFLAFLGNTHQG